MRTSAYADTPSPLSAFVRIYLHPLPPSCGRPLWMTPYEAQLFEKLNIFKGLLRKKERDDD